LKEEHWEPFSGGARKEVILDEGKSGLALPTKEKGKEKYF